MKKSDEERKQELELEELELRKKEREEREREEREKKEKEEKALKRSKIFAFTMLCLLGLVLLLVWSVGGFESPGNTGKTNAEKRMAETREKRDNRDEFDAKVHCEDAIERPIIVEYKWTSFLGKWAYSRREDDGDWWLSGTELMIANEYGRMEKWLYECSYDPGTKTTEIALVPLSP